MNNSAQGQPAQGQSGTQQPRPQIFRPEQMRQLPDKFTAEEKHKWEQGLRQLYAQIENQPKDSPQAQEAKRKLFDFSKTLHGKIQAYRLQQAQAAQQAQQGGGEARPNSQGQPQGQGESSGQDPNANQPARQKFSQKIMDHVNKFPYVIPSHLQPGSAEAQKWIQEVKQKYVKGLVAMENASGRVTALDAMVAKREAEGKPLSAEEEVKYREQKEAAQKQHADASKFVESFRNSQKQAAQQAGGPASQQSGNGNGVPTPTRPQMTMQQPPNSAIQNTQTINAAMEAARNQQMGGPRPSIPNSQASQMPNQNASSHPNMPQHQSSQVQNIKQEAGVGVSQINTSVNQQRPMNNSPQSAVPPSAGPQSATSQQVPRALTHQAALQTAARTYSNGPTSSTPNVMGQHHPHPPAPRETGNVMTNKMPIPKHLPERATAPPQAVAMPNARPSLSGGPSNSGSGVLSQPVLQKPPGYNLDTDGDRVLNKKKLDELVRQVTGGGEGLGSGEGLTPEVEEVLFSLHHAFTSRHLCTDVNHHCTFVNVSIVYSQRRRQLRRSSPSSSMQKC
jgi:transcription initiation factor TFIID subunit 12